MIRSHDYVVPHLNGEVYPDKPPLPFWIMTVPMRIFGIDGWESTEFLSIGGPAVEGGYFSTHYSAESRNPTVIAFNERFQQRWGIPSDAISALGYDSVMLLVDAMKRAAERHVFLCPERLHHLNLLFRSPDAIAKILVQADEQRS